MSSNLTSLGLNEVYKENINCGYGTVTDDCGDIWTKVGIHSWCGYVSVKDFGAVGDGVANDTAAIQAAIDTGLNVYFPKGTYNVQGLIVSTAGQILFGDSFGTTALVRNQNGTIITFETRSWTLRDMMVRGEDSTPTFTGDNIVINHASNSLEDGNLINVWSRWTLGRALYAPGKVSGLMIRGGSYSHEGTPGDPAIILGSTSLTAQFAYATIEGVVQHVTNQPIRTYAAGGLSVIGGQIGGIDFLSSTTVAPTVNKVLGCRILGDVNIVGASNIFVGNSCGAITVTFALDAMGVANANDCVWVGNAEDNTAVVTNSGVANNLIIRNNPNGVAGVSFGGTTSVANLLYDTASGDFEFPGNIGFPNAKNFQQRRASGASLIRVAGYNGSDNLFLGQDTIGTFTSVVAPTDIYNQVGATTVTNCQVDRFRPQTANAIKLGDATHDWSDIYSRNALTVISDERIKDKISKIDDKILDAWKKVEWCSYKFKMAIEAKGEEAARTHFGLIAQQVLKAFKEEGLDAHKFGMFCYDEWPEHYELERIVVDPKTGQSKEIMKLIPAGYRYSLRYEQCLVLEAALYRREIANLTAKVENLASQKPSKDKDK